MESNDERTIQLKRKIFTAWERSKGWDPWLRAGILGEDVRNGDLESALELV